MEVLFGVSVAVLALAVAYSQGLSRGRREGKAAAMIEVRAKLDSPGARTIAQTLAYKEKTGEWPSAFTHDKTANQRAAEGDI